MISLNRPFLRDAAKNISVRQIASYLLICSIIAEGGLIPARERECSSSGGIKRASSDSLKGMSESEFRMSHYTVRDKMFSTVARAIFADDHADGFEVEKVLESGVWS